MRDETEFPLNRFSVLYPDLLFFSFGSFTEMMNSRPPSRINTSQSTRSASSSGNPEFDMILTSQIDLTTKLEWERQRGVHIEESIEVCFFTHVFLFFLLSFMYLYISDCDMNCGDSTFDERFLTSRSKPDISVLNMMCLLWEKEKHRD